METENSKTIFAKSVRLKKIKEFIDKKDIYNNLFLFLKLKHLLHFEKKKDIYIPQHITDKYINEYLTFLDISGVSIIGSDTLLYLDNFSSMNMIFIPPSIIENFFSWNQTNCQEENKYVSNKLDLYFSLLTYIYISSFLPTSGKQNDFHNRIMHFVKENISTDNINLLYNARIYNFLEIPNEIDKFKYGYKDTRINSNQYYKHYSESTNIGGNIEINIAFHHLITLFRFYNQYILTYFFVNPIHYEFHPLLLVKKSVSSVEL